jgi:hypothetical protein
VLKVQYDDGFSAWVYGVRVMDADAPEETNLADNATAAASGDDTQSVTFREFDITSVKSLLKAGNNTLAIQGMNSGSGSADFLLTPTLYARAYSYPSAGQVYYTTDGSDPRAAGGAVAAGAIPYSGALSLSTNTRVKARTLVNGAWSGLSDQAYTFGAAALRVTELMYNPPAPPVGSPYTAQDFEFIEFKNTGTTPLALGGFQITKGVTFAFPSVTLGAGGYGVVVKNHAAFQSRYGTSLNVLGAYTGNFDNGGETVTVTDGFAQTVQSFTYEDTWYTDTDGHGYSLVIRDPAGALANWGTAAGWRTSYAPLGLPGQDDADTTPPVLASGAYNPATGTVLLTFSEPVTIASPSGTSISETLGNTPVTPAGETFGASTLTISLAASPADGVYRVTVPAAAVTDQSGNAMAAGAMFTFVLVGGGHTLALPQGHAAIAVDQIALGAGAKLDVRDVPLIDNGDAAGSWNGSAYTGVTGLVAAGRNGGSWDGAGIVSSLAGGNDYTTLAVATAGEALGLTGAQTSTWDGQVVHAGSVLIKYTYGGDANLDGQINIDDYSNIDGSVAVGGQLKGWFNGDFNYDGDVNIDDYSIIDGNIGIQGPPL